MAADMYKEISSVPTVTKRAIKKQQKKLRLLQNEEGFTVVESPTEFLVICNGGLVCGVSQELLLETFLPHGSILNVTMIPEKPFAFITFTSVEAAANVMASCQHIKLSCSAGLQTVLYLSYVDKVPKCQKLQSYSCKDLPPGLIMLENIVTDEYENDLLFYIENKSLLEANLKNRQVIHFGYEFHYDSNHVDTENPLEVGIPDVCNAFLSKLLEMGLLKEKPDQLTINIYLPGQGIPPHLDTHSCFEEELISLSLGSSLVMDWRSPDGVHLPVLLPQKSVIIMTKESRYVWTHGITPRKTDIICASNEKGLSLQNRQKRISLTFRKVRKSPCQCAFPNYCDSQRNLKKNEEFSLSVSPKEAAELERDHVHSVYESIASHFSGTRHTPWPRVASFIKQQPFGAFLLDVGCGNGKYLMANDHLIRIGCDRSSQLTKICKERDIEVITSDCLMIPLRSETVDVCTCIAVLHHLCTEERRLTAIKELKRVLVQGGKALVYVWALEQENDETDASSYVKKPKKGRSSDNHQAVLNSGCSSTTCNPANIEICCDDPSDNLEFSCHEDDDSFKSAATGMKNNGQLVTSSKMQLTNFCMHKTNSKSYDHASALQPHSLPVHANRTRFEQQDLLVPWHLRGRTKQQQRQISEPVYHRYYHVFCKGELESLCKRVENLSILESYYDKGNWCVIFEKKRLG